MCAKSVKLCPPHILTTVRLILNAARRLDDNHDDGKALSSRQNRTTIQRLLQMRDLKYNATALHWLALDPRPTLLKVAGLMLQHGGKSLTQAVDRRGQTPLDWARKHALAEPDHPQTEDTAAERQRHVERWEVMMLAWEEEM